MKNKKLTIILLPLVVAIWGTIFWKIFSGGNQTPSPATPVSRQQMGVQEGNAVRDTINLSFQYPDPFLGTRWQEPDEMEAPVNPVVRPNVVVAWPSVEYMGSVGKHNGTKRLAMLVIGSREFLVRENETTQNIKILSIARDSVKLEYQGDARVLRRSGS